MEQLNTFPIYSLGKWIDSVFLHSRQPLKQNIFAWHYARQVLDFLIAQAPGHFHDGASTATACRAASAGPPDTFGLVRRLSSRTGAPE